MLSVRPRPDPRYGSTVPPRRERSNCESTPPTPGAEYTIYAISPARTPFAVSTGVTDADGRAGVELGLRASAALAGTNLTFFGEVATANGVRSSSSVHLRVPAEGGTFERTRFEVIEDVVPPAEGVGISWAELADIDSDGDLDALVPGSRPASIATPVEHASRGAFKSPDFVVSDESWKLPGGSYATGGFALDGEVVMPTRGYFSFDLTGVNGTVVGADIEIGHPKGSYTSANEIETVSLFEVTTAAEELAAPDESLGLDALERIFEDLGDGEEYGVFAAEAALNGTTEDISLSEAAVAAINLAVGAGSWSVGTAITTTDGEDSFGGVFAGSSDASPAAVLVLAVTSSDEPGVEYLRIFENDGAGQFSSRTADAISAEEQRSTDRVFPRRRDRRRASRLCRHAALGRFGRPRSRFGCVALRQRRHRGVSARRVLSGEVRFGPGPVCGGLW